LTNLIRVCYTWGNLNQGELKMATVTVKVEYQVEYPDGITEGDLDIHEILYDTSAIKKLDLTIKSNKRTWLPKLKQ
jgi:hypothetical protein